jgi:hypothetical protein
MNIKPSGKNRINLIATAVRIPYRRQYMRRKQLVYAFLMILAVMMAGCKKSETYLGTYKLSITPEMQKQIDEGMAKSKGKPEEAMAKELLKSMLDVSVVLKPEGKATFSAMGQSQEGTYTVDGDKITISPGGSGDKGGTKTELIYDETKQELSMTQNGQKVVLKKQAEASK